MDGYHNIVHQIAFKQLVVMAKPPRAFASRWHCEAAGMGTWRMVVRLARQKSWIFHSKGALAIECRTYTWLVSPADGPKKKKGGLHK